MIYPSLSSLMKGLDSRYSLVMAVAKRARDLSNEEALPLVPVTSEKMVTVALNEIAGNRLVVRRIANGGVDQTLKKIERAEHYMAETAAYSPRSNNSDLILDEI